MCGKGKKHIMHGMSKSPEYKRWLSMKNRCFDVNIRSYQTYGARGKIICDGWVTDFRNFFADMGPMPGPGYEVDRINNRIGYTCGKCHHCFQNGWPFNCRWATDFTQSRNRTDNRMLMVNGLPKCLADASAEAGLPSSTVHQRLGAGLSVEEALRPERMHQKYREIAKIFVTMDDGRVISLAAGCRETGRKYSTVRSIAKRTKLSLPEAFHLVGKVPRKKRSDTGGKNMPEILARLAREEHPQDIAAALGVCIGHVRAVKYKLARQSRNRG